MAELQLWKTDECQPFAHFRRNDIADGIKVQKYLEKSALYFKQTLSD